MNRLNKNFRGLMMVCALFSILLLAGCNDNSVTNPNAIQQVTYASNKGGPLNTLRLDSVKLLIGNAIPGLRQTSKNVLQRTNFNILHIPDAVHANLNSGISQVSIYMPEGITLDMLTMQIGKYSTLTKPSDLAFIYNGEIYGILVYGVFNEQQFTFRSKREVQQTNLLPSPITINNEQRVNFSIKVKPDEWFRTKDGYINPSDPENQSVIDDLIAASFKQYSTN